VVALEAFTLGLPVVAYDVGGLSRVIRMSSHGTPSEPGRIDDLAANVLKVLDCEQAESVDAENTDRFAHRIMDRWRAYYHTMVGFDD